VLKVCYISIQFTVSILLTFQLFSYVIWGGHPQVNVLIKQKRRTAAYHSATRERGCHCITPPPGGGAVPVSLVHQGAWLPLHSQRSGTTAQSKSKDIKHERAIFYYFPFHLNILASVPFQWPEVESIIHPSTVLWGTCIVLNHTHFVLLYTFPALQCRGKYCTHFKALVTSYFTNVNDEYRV